MLKNLDPVLNADLLQILRQMGHGDELAIVDANFPAYAQGPRVVRLDGVDATRALDAILTLMPLDDFVEETAWRMQVVGAPDAQMPIFDEFRAIVTLREGERHKIGALERYAFYARTAKCFALVATSERRLYGNIIVKMGVVREN
jgi:L-fucose mutarotase